MGYFWNSTINRCEGKSGHIIRKQIRIIVSLFFIIIFNIQLYNIILIQQQLSNTLKVFKSETSFFFKIKNACQDTVDLIVQLNVLIHYTDTDVKDIVTVAITRVMYQQDVEQSHQVFYKSERYSVEILKKC